MSSEGECELKTSWLIKWVAMSMRQWWMTDRNTCFKHSLQSRGSRPPPDLTWGLALKCGCVVLPCFYLQIRTEALGRRGLRAHGLFCLFGQVLQHYTLLHWEAPAHTQTWQSLQPQTLTKFVSFSHLHFCKTMFWVLVSMQQGGSVLSWTPCPGTMNLLLDPSN